MAVRNADDILIGGGKVYIDEKELGWLSGEIKVEEQANSHAVKESEGGTVLTINLDKEVHFTFSLLEANLETLKALNPSSGEGTGLSVGTFQSDDTYDVKFVHTKRSGATRTLHIFKGKVSGTFTPLIINQDNESPIPVDIVAMADDSKPATGNLYEIYDTPANSSGSNSSGTGGN